MRPNITETLEILFRAREFNVKTISLYNPFKPPSREKRNTDNWKPVKPEKQGNEEPYTSEGVADIIIKTSGLMEIIEEKNNTTHRRGRSRNKR